MAELWLDFDDLVEQTIEQTETWDNLGCHVITFCDGQKWLDPWADNEKVIIMGD